MNGNRFTFQLVTVPLEGLNPAISASVEWPGRTKQLDVLLTFCGHEQNWRPRLSQAGVPDAVITAIGRDFHKLTRGEKV